MTDCPDGEMAWTANQERLHQRPASVALHPTAAADHLPLTLHQYLRFGAAVDVNRTVRILPAPRRALLCFTPWDDIIDAPLVDAGPPTEPERSPDGTRRVAAFAWDDSIGRLVLAETDAEVLRVYDFAHEPKLGEGSSREMMLGLGTKEDVV
ncbi:hypothetical protein NUW54_g4630 [Trametes sanguinea]|uniref:Uncharacterized protein n=1 Tax=Trametes sanguinea TaxID=158606 RepID=A0ACC1Q0G8_9APHY|nr:hypothetical protein NUW54_g4630 [Trametes sanguinea]